MESHFGFLPPRLSIVAIIVLGFIFGFVLVRYVLQRLLSHDSTEPPYIWPTVPIIGHLIGMLRYGATYFDIVKYANIVILDQVSPA